MGWEEDVDVLLSMEVLLLGIARFSFICDHAQQNNVTPLTLPAHTWLNMSRKALILSSLLLLQPLHNKHSRAAATTGSERRHYGQ
jgi:hypothetical protein